jgi:hypothetical protein
MTAIVNSNLDLLLVKVGRIPAKVFAHPVRNFFVLRREIARRMSLFGSMRTLGTVWMFLQDDRLETRDPRLDDTGEALRELGIRMLSFGKRADPGTYLLRLMRYDPLKAGNGLIDLSNEFQRCGAARAIHRHAVEDALRLRRFHCR